jgi:membrane-associated protease RseP (regulator of RpoE activity)
MGQLSRCCSGRTQIAINLLSSGILPSAADLADLTSLASSATLEPSDRGLLVCLVRLANEYGGSEDFSTRIMVGVQQYMEEQEQESEGDADEGDTTSFPYTTGVKIKELVEGGAAEQAGLQVEDVILTVNDIKVADSDDILRIVAEANAVEIKVVFLNGENGKVEWMMVRPQAGRFGIGGAAVEFIQD